MLNTKKEIDNSADELCDAANKAGRAVSSAYYAASDEIIDAAEAVKTKIRTNPIQSSLIALAAGFVLSALLRR